MLECDSVVSGCDGTSKMKNKQKIYNVFKCKSPSALHKHKAHEQN